MVLQQRKNRFKVVCLRERNLRVAQTGVKVLLEPFPGYFDLGVCSESLRECSLSNLGVDEREKLAAARKVIMVKMVFPSSVEQ